MEYLNLWAPSHPYHFTVLSGPHLSWSNLGRSYCQSSIRRRIVWYFILHCECWRTRSDNLPDRWVNHVYIEEIQFHITKKIRRYLTWTNQIPPSLHYWGWTREDFKCRFRFSRCNLAIQTYEYWMGWKLFHSGFVYHIRTSWLMQEFADDTRPNEFLTLPWEDDNLFLTGYSRKYSISKRFKLCWSHSSNKIHPTTIYLCRSYRIHKISSCFKDINIRSA